MQIPRQLELPKRVAVQTLDDEAPELAAGLAYRFLFALFPFAIFVSALAAFVSQAVGLGDPTDEILGAVGDNLPPDVASQISPQLQQVLGETRPGLLSFGALLALWAATSAISSPEGHGSALAGPFVEQDAGLEPDERADLADHLIQVLHVVRCDLQGADDLQQGLQIVS